MKKYLLITLLIILGIPVLALAQQPSLATGIPRWGLVLLMFALAFIVGFAYRALAKYFAEHSVRGRSQNIGKRDRLIRLALAVALFFFVILTTWNPLILFFSGFCLFEAIFSWCGLYTALGKNTCPV